MTTYRVIVFLFLASLATALVPSIAHAQRNEISARIAFTQQGGIVDVVLTGRRGDTLYARPKEAASGSITYEAGDIKRIAVALPAEELRRAETAASSGRHDDALKLLRPIVRPLLPFLDLPIDNAVEPALLYAASARAEKAWSEAISVYKAIQKNPDPLVSQEGAGWLAYSYMRNQQAKEAEEWVAQFIEKDPRNRGFVPAALAAALLHGGRGEDEAALDHAARAAALDRIDDELYPEAVYLSADAYYRMAQKAPPVATVKSDVVLQRNNQDVPEAYAPMLPEEFLGVASNQFARLVEMFPSSPFAAKAKEALDRISKNVETTNDPVEPKKNGDTP